MNIAKLETIFEIANNQKYFINILIIELCSLLLQNSKTKMATKAQSEKQTAKKTVSDSLTANQVKTVKQTDPAVRKLLDDIRDANKELGSRGMAPLKKLLVSQGVISDASLSQILSGTFVSKSNIPHAKEILKRIKELTSEKAKSFKAILSTPSSKLPKVEEKKRGKPAKIKTETIAKAKAAPLKKIKNKASETPVGTKIDLTKLKRREKNTSTVQEAFELSNPTTQPELQTA